MAADIQVVGLHDTVKSLVQQHLGIIGQVFPGGKAARRDFRAAVPPGILLAVKKMPPPPGPGGGEAGEQSLQFVQQIGRWAEMAEAVIAQGGGLIGQGVHLGAVVAVKAGAVDKGGGDAACDAKRMRL